MNRRTLEGLGTTTSRSHHRFHRTVTSQSPTRTPLICVSNVTTAFRYRARALPRSLPGVPFTPAAVKVAATSASVGPKSASSRSICVLRPALGVDQFLMPVRPPSTSRPHACLPSQWLYRCGEPRTSTRTRDSVDLQSAHIGKERGARPGQIEHARKGFQMFNSLSSSFLWRGLLAIVVGIVATAWPGVTILAVVIIFAVLAFGDAFLEAARGFSSDSAAPALGSLVLAVLGVVAGVVALAWPGITAVVLTIWIAAWAVVSGVVELVMA